MALNINADDSQQSNQNQQPNQEQQPMNQQNSGFGPPPQDQAPAQQPQNPQNGFGGPPPQQAPHQDPNPQAYQQPQQQAPQQQPQNQQPQNQGGGFAGSFNQQPTQQPQQQQPANYPQQPHGGYGGQAPAQAPQQPQNQGVPQGLMKTGSAAYEAFQSAQTNTGGDHRFFLKKGEERTLVFMDGDLDANGFFLNPVTREHTVKMNNKYQNILCLNEQEPCPLCAIAGENSPVSKASFVCYFTVLDRTGYVDNSGNAHRDFVSIYVAKTQTLKQLQAFAKKAGGLKGQEFSVSRSQSNNAPRVGDVFFPGQKYNVEQEIIPYFVNQGRKPEDFQPYDYAKQVVYYSADQLRAMGFNDGHFNGAPVGAGGGMNQGNPQGQPPQNQGGFGNQQQPQQTQGGFGNQPQGGFGGQPPQQAGPTPTNVNYEKDL